MCLVNFSNATRLPNVHCTKWASISSEHREFNHVHTWTLPCRQSVTYLLTHLSNRSSISGKFSSPFPCTSTITLFYSWVSNKIFDSTWHLRFGDQFLNRHRVEIHPPGKNELIFWSDQTHETFGTLPVAFSSWCVCLARRLMIGVWERFVQYYFLFY